MVKVVSCSEGDAHAGAALGKIDRLGAPPVGIRDGPHYGQTESGSVHGELVVCERLESARHDRLREAGALVADVYAYETVVSGCGDQHFAARGRMTYGVVEEVLEGLAEPDRIERDDLVGRFDLD